MKKLAATVLTLVLLLATVQAVYAQEGVITYENTMNMHRRLGPDQEAMKSMMPEYRTTKQQVFYNAQESLYKPLEEDEDFSTSGGGMRMTMRVPLNEFYYNQSTAQKVALLEFMGKKYIIEDSIRISPWKFGTETKTILGYTCRQAYYDDEAKKMSVVAWFTDEIRPALGPESYNTLPGTVLAVDINNGERVIKAVKVDKRGLKKGEMALPTKGQKVTQQEYQAMVDEQMEKMKRNGGNVIIRN
jgi:GLPGLI family protein